MINLDERIEIQRDTHKIEYVTVRADNGRAYRVPLSEMPKRIQKALSN